jgi:hypothetical protein
MGHEPRKPGRDGIREILDSGRAPAVSVRGVRRNHEMAEKHKIPVDQRLDPLGRDADQLERSYDKVLAFKAKEAARAKRARGSSRRRDGQIRLLGSVPLHEYIARRRMVGEAGVKNGDFSEELKRCGRIRED